MMQRRVPRDEASRRAQCGKFARCVRRAGEGDGTAASGTRALPRLYYLPLYIFCGRHLLAAKLRRSNIDGAAGAVEEVARIVAQIRRRWPRTRILLRGDSGFTREPLMAWCEANRVDYVFGLARNDRLEQAIVPELISATVESIRTARTARCFKDFSYATLSTWYRERRVIGKAEVTGGEANPRFIVTSLKRGEASARHLYEKIYCARGDMENRIKECQLDLFAAKFPEGRRSNPGHGCVDSTGIGSYPGPGPGYSQFARALQ
jgi:Transposase DDE domain group 1